MERIKKSKLFHSIIMMFATLMILIPVSFTTNVYAVAKKTPGTVKLTKITAVDYNKIKVQWNKASNATSYVIYYKPYGSKSWKKIKRVSSKTTSYTHTASKSFPITVGQKYTYTVKAYNSKAKKYGKYNTKGLTTKTKPQKVKLKTISVNKDNEVTITWEKAVGADKYCIYARNEKNTKWLHLEDVSKDTTSFVDKFPYYQQDNIYTVKAYNNKGKSYGPYDTNGLKIYVGGDVEDDPSYIPPDYGKTYTEEEFAEEIFRLTNIERVKAGLAPFLHHANVKLVSNCRAKELTVYYAHTRPNGLRCVTAGGEFDTYVDGENIGITGLDPKSIVDGWMNSPGHKRSIINSNYIYMEAGVKKSGSSYYCVQTFASTPDKKEKVIVDANGGYFPQFNNATTHEYIFSYNKLVKVDKDLDKPVRDGYVFDGWYKYDYNRTYTGFYLNSPSPWELKARWVKK